MGLFDGLFGKEKKAKFDKISPFDNLPAFLKDQGRDIGTGAFDVFQDLIEGGETGAAKKLFSQSRTGTIKSFHDATEQAGLNLNRLGLGSSGERDKTFASLALSLGDVLATQDARRSEALRAQQSAGAAQGLNAINSISGQTALIPRTQTKGLFDGLGTSLIGIGTAGVLGGIGSGVAGGIGNIGKVGGFGAGFGSGFGQGFSDVFSNISG